MNFVSNVDMFTYIEGFNFKIVKKKETNRKKCNIQLIYQKNFDIDNGIY